MVPTRALAVLGVVCVSCAIIAVTFFNDSEAETISPAHDAATKLNIKDISRGNVPIMPIMDGNRVRRSTERKQKLLSKEGKVKALGWSDGGRGPRMERKGKETMAKRNHESKQKAKAVKLAADVKMAGCPFSTASAAPCTFAAAKPETTFLSATPPPLSPSQYVTNQGCKCKSACGAQVTDSYARCDWCRTEDNCGESSWGGSWDYCKYAPPMKQFEAQAHATKMSQMWERLTSPGAVGKSADPRGMASVLSQMVSESMITTFEDQWEVMPEGRSKVIHTQGAHCSFKLDVTSDMFTGLLAKGTRAGLIRMGSATNLEALGGGMFPGMGIKFFRSGIRSANFVALRATGPGGSSNFFDSVFSNHVAPPSALVALNKFQQASGCIDMVGLSDVCAYSQDGEKVASPIFPFELQFEPTPTMKTSHKDGTKTNDALLKMLSSLPAATKLFDVYAFASPSDKLAGKRSLVGSMSSSSQCVQSLFGDTRMYFRHQRMEEDFAAKPEWIKQVPALKDPACTASVGPVSKWQCPMR